jgi:Protein of unknown function (DUF3551)
MRQRASAPSSGAPQLRSRKPPRETGSSGVGQVDYDRQFGTWVAGFDQARRAGSGSREILLVKWGKLQGAFLDEEKPMRSRIFLLALVSAALMEVTGPAAAQSPYSYPWCSRQTAGKGDTTTCYFTSYAQCMTTISGIGGWCYQNPSYNGAYHASTPRRRRY